MASRMATKADLVRQVLSTVWRDQDDPDFASEVDGWIALAEQKLCSELRIRQMVVRACEEIQSRYLTLPADWLEAIDLRTATGALLPMEREDTARYGNGATGTPAWMLYGPRPSHYAIVGDQLELVPDPTPAAGSVGEPAILEMTYYARPAALVGDLDTNAVLVDFPAVYLYATLSYAAPHLDHDERVQTWAGLYADAVAAANLAWERAGRSGGRLN